MCNRYTPARGQDLQRDMFGAPQVNFPPGPLFPSYGRRIGPNADGPFLRLTVQGVEEVIGQWGLIRPGMPTRLEKVKGRPRLTNNCRSDGMAVKPTFKAAWTQSRRCLISCWSFDDPNWETGKNVWWEMRRADGRPWALAGLWSEWTDPASGEVVPSYTMITVNADHHPLMNRLHRPDPDLPPDQQDKRSVVPLSPADWDRWLHTHPEDARTLLVLPEETDYRAGPADSMPPPATEQPQLI